MKKLILILITVSVNTICLANTKMDEFVTENSFFGVYGGFPLEDLKKEITLSPTSVEGRYQSNTAIIDNGFFDTYIYVFNRDKKLCSVVTHIKDLSTIDDALYTLKTLNKYIINIFGEPYSYKEKESFYFRSPTRYELRHWIILKHNWNAYTAIHKLYKSRPDETDYLKK